MKTRYRVSCKGMEVATGNDFFKIFKKFQKYHHVMAFGFLFSKVFEFLKNIDF